ncbi:MAG TPA: hypothetical protein VM434_02230 [Beijerinckiaceae bacterium]|nr:hypothetical protein [Beijerinckiaceae bacterium]
MNVLVQILLPLYDNDGRPQPASRFAAVRSELTERFGGFTAFTRAPAEGAWKDGNEVARDDIVVVEVMVEALDEGWWRDYRRSLESRFRQEEIVVRAQDIRLL